MSSGPGAAGAAEAESEAKDHSDLLKLAEYALMKGLKSGIWASIFRATRKIIGNEKVDEATDPVYVFRLNASVIINKLDNTEELPLKADIVTELAKAGEAWSALLRIEEYGIKSVWKLPLVLEDDQNRLPIPQLKKFLKTKLDMLPIPVLHLKRKRMQEVVHKFVKTGRLQWKKKHEKMLVAAVKEYCQPGLVDNIWKHILADDKYAELKDRCPGMDSRQVNRDKYKALWKKDYIQPHPSLPDIGLTQIHGKTELLIAKKQAAEKTKIAREDARKEAIKERIRRLQEVDSDDEDSDDDEDDDEEEDEDDDDEDDDDEDDDDEDDDEEDDDEEDAEENGKEEEQEGVKEVEKVDEGGDKDREGKKKKKIEKDGNCDGVQTRGNRRNDSNGSESESDIDWGNKRGKGRGRGLTGKGTDRSRGLTDKGTGKGRGITKKGKGNGGGLTGKGNGRGGEKKRLSGRGKR